MAIKRRDLLKQIEASNVEPLDFCSTQEPISKFKKYFGAKFGPAYCVKNLEVQFTKHKIHPLHLYD